MGMWVGRGRKARVAYGFDDIALVPGAVTVNPNEVDISWEIGGHRYQLPILAEVPFDEGLAEAERSGRPPIDFDPDCAAIAAIARLCRTLQER